MKKIIKMLLAIIGSLILAFLLIAFIIGFSISAPSYSGPTSDHFEGKNFINPGRVKAKGLYEVLRWAINREPGEWEKEENASYGVKPANLITHGVRVTFINHSTFLIQVDGLNILTDPIWSERASPFSWIGPERMRPPGIRFEDLPPIDVVLISHNHYDHLDIPTMEKIVSRHNPKIVTPLGVTKFLTEQKTTGKETIDLDWWEKIKINDSVSIQAVPAQHFSGRGMGDRDATLWCGYVIYTKDGNLYFAGDTGYNTETFKTIGERAGSIKIALIPIGSYKPQWFMSPIHVSPEEAVKIHLDINAQKSIGIHFGTFPLGDDGQYDPIEDLQKAKEKLDVSESGFIVLDEGSYYETL